MVVDLKPNEVVVKASDTNYFYDDERIKGKLILTNQRIYFKSINGQSGKFDIEIVPEDIKEIMFFNTFKIFPNGLNIINKQGQQLRFVVKKRDSWCRLINKMY
ncbi:MAG: hypothetical protein KAT68_12340 [Bacteroidales bacterium]|nr:hypothetical protein [Bacteroidales bacterium]